MGKIAGANVDSTDDGLLAAAQAGNHEAFLFLYNRHGRSIFNFLYRLLNSETAAEDISHDCFIDLIRKPDHFKSNHDSLLIQLYRRGRDLAVQYVNEIGESNPSPSREHTDELHHGLADREVVKTAINRLPLPEREVLILFEYQGLSLNEIAFIVGSDHDMVAVRLNDARRSLRDQLSRYLS